MIIENLLPSIVPTYNEAFITGIAGTPSEFNSILINFGDYSFILGFFCASLIALVILFFVNLLKPLNNFDHAN